MYQAFTSLLNRSLSASVLIAFLLLLRPLIKKAPKYHLCLLWALVAIRLLLPFGISSSLSVFNLLGVSAAANGQAEYLQYTGHSEKPTIQLAPSILHQTSSLGAASTSHTPDLYLPLLMQLWLIGVLFLLIYGLSSYIRLKKQIAASIPLEEGIFLCDDIQTPFVCGIFNPKIYLPSGLPHQARSSVISHELAHIQRKDHWWKPLGFVLLALHWFNPMVWTAYLLFCRDVEAACDEKAIQNMNTDQKAAYSQALLSCAAPKRLITVYPLTFGEIDVKERIKNIISHKKPAFWMIAAGAAVCIVTALCFLSDPIAARVPANRSDIVGYYAFEEGFGGPFTLTLEEDGTFYYSEGYLSSHIGLGSWDYDGQTVVLWDTTASQARKATFTVDGTSLIFVSDESDPFIYLDLENGTEFLPVQTSEAPAVKYTAQWPQNQFTERIFPPSTGTVNYIIDQTEDGRYAVFLSDITLEASEAYVEELRNAGYIERAGTKNSVAVGVMLQKEDIILSITYSEDVLGIQLIRSAS